MEGRSTRIWSACVSRLRFTGTNLWLVLGHSLSPVEDSAGPGMTLVERTLGESSFSPARIAGRAGYSPFRTFLLGPSLASDLWWENIVGDKSPCQLLLSPTGGLNQRKLQSFLREDHQDQLCLALVRTCWPRMRLVRLEGPQGAAHLHTFKQGSPRGLIRLSSLWRTFSRQFRVFWHFICLFKKLAYWLPGLYSVK